MDISGRKLNNLLVLLALPALFLTAGCSTMKTPKSGFLVDYSEFQFDSKDKSLLWYEKEGTDWKRFRKLMIDPVVVYYHPDARNRKIDPQELQKLTAYFREVVVQEVKDKYPVVDKAGPDVLRVRAAITDVIPVNVAANILSAAAIGIPLDMGGAAIEAEFLDSETGERLGAIVDMKLGTPLDISGFTSLGHARSAFQKWAREFKQALSEP
ncbi:MAG: DUF3313 domain-containing protein [Candidatus Omnitrophica bacterium]|nr:DUF3313 domain-containing protein [Candidatus Omnitrophota bacterium]